MKGKTLHLFSQDNFTWFRICPPGSIVDKGVFEESAEDKEDADPGPDVDGLGVGHRGQRVLDACLHERGGVRVKTNAKKSQNIFHQRRHNFDNLVFS